MKKLSLALILLATCLVNLSAREVRVWDIPWKVLESSEEWKTLILTAFPDSEVLFYYEDEHIRILLLQDKELLVFSEGRHVVQGPGAQVFDGRDYDPGQYLPSTKVLPAEMAEKLPHLWMLRFSGAVRQSLQFTYQYAQDHPGDMLIFTFDKDRVTSLRKLQN